MAKAKAKEKKVFDFEAVGEARTEMIDLAMITDNTAQSRGMGVLSALKQEGHGVFEKESTDKDPIWEMLFSDKPEVQAEACFLLEKHEERLVRLADSIHKSGQLQPIGVREVDKSYDIIYGMRRAIAHAYNFAKKRSKSTDVEARVYDQEMGAVQLKLLALKENDDRDGESPIDKAITFRFLMKEGGMDAEQVAKHMGKSGQHIRDYVKLLSKELEDKQMSIHLGKLKVEPALKLLIKRKAGKEGTNGEDRGGGKGANRFRMPSVKGIIKIYDAERKPKDMPEKEWALWTTDDVRKFLALKLGLKFSKFVEKPAEEKAPKPTGGTVLKITRERANQLMLLLNQMNCRTWDDKKMQDALENIPQYADEDVSVGTESESHQKLLDKVRECYAKGTKIQILKDKK